MPNQRYTARRRANEDLDNQLNVKRAKIFANAVPLLCSMECSYHIVGVHSTMCVNYNQGEVK